MMNPRSKATYHHGTCHQCHGEGDVLTIADATDRVVAKEKGRRGVGGEVG
jgi:hypothetical protein